MTAQLLTGALLADGRLVDVALDGGVISAVEPSLARGSVNSADLSGYVLLPSFVEPHAHLDKALTVGRAPHCRPDCSTPSPRWTGWR